MAQLAESKDTYTAHFEKFAGRANGDPAWLRRAREAALARFQERGFPTTRDEEWRFTPVAPIVAANLVPTVAQNASVGIGGGEHFWLKDVGPQFLLVNGELKKQLDADPLPKGVTVRMLVRDGVADAESFATAPVARPDIKTTAFFDLNTAFLKDALVIEVAPHAVVEKPIHVICLTVGENVMATPRIYLRAGERAEVSFVESYFGAPVNGSTSLTNAVTIITAGQGAIVKHVKLQREHGSVFHLGSQFQRLERGATITSHAITLGGKIARNDIVSTLDGDGGECTLNGLYVGAGDALVDTHTTIDHAMPHCPSHEVYKGILTGKAKAVFNGKIVVRQDAQKTNAKQTNKALLLTDEAQVNTKPQLEIFADDVKCTHGAAIGQLDEDALFYLRARGIDTVSARNMLIHAFAGDVLDGIDVPVVRETAMRLVEDLLSLPHEA